MGAQLAGCAPGEIRDDLVPEGTLLARRSLAELEGGQRCRKPLDPDPRRRFPKWDGTRMHGMDPDRTAGTKGEKSGKA